MKFISKKKHFIILITALFLLIKASAQTEEPIKSDLGDIITLHSEILKEDRKIMIYSPKDSAHMEKAYPVMYVLDADNHFAQMVEYSKYLSRPDVDVTPAFIVVGIKHTDRVRDLTPTHSNFGPNENPLKTSGGNEQLFKFIEKELMPYVNSKYKIQPYRIFAGHSLGGITTLNCLINYPDLFNAYIAVSPSLAWDRKYVLKLADKKLKTGSVVSKTLFFSDGNEGVAWNPTFHSDVLELDSLLRKRNITGLNFEYKYYPAENHMTVTIKSYYDALRFIYKSWEFSPATNEDVIPVKIMKHYNGLSQKFGYTILPRETQFDEGIEWFMKSPGTQDQAISLLEMNAVNYPYSSKAFAALGAAYAIKGEKQKALAFYKKASELNPSSNEIKLRLEELQK